MIADAETQDLLAAFVKNRSETAFRELVSRYIDLVYSTALRLVDGDTHRAEDVSQIVFTDLSKMAPRLSGNVLLGGWLHRHTSFVARTVMRGERRRQLRERMAAEMKNLEANEPIAEIWPILDETIQALGADDRDAILLRFYERRNLRSVGEALGINENVAQKRVARAVQELGTLLRRRGVVLSTSGLAAGLAASAVQAAPPLLTARIAGAVFGGVAAGASGGTAAGAATAAKSKAIAWAALVLFICTAILFVRYENSNANSDAPLAQNANRKTPALSPHQLNMAVPTPGRQQPHKSAATLEREMPPTPSSVATTEPSATRATPVSTVAASPTQRLLPIPGKSFVRITGSSTLHDWQVESQLILGFLVPGPGFPTNANQHVEPGPLSLQVDAFIPVTSLKSIKAGRPYSDAMNKIMYDNLKFDRYPRIQYRLLEISLIQTTNEAGTFEYICDSRGELSVAGVTNEISMPITIALLSGGVSEIVGSTPLKLTSFGIDPPSHRGLGMLIQTADDITVTFDWVVGPRTNNVSLSGNVPRFVQLVLSLPAPAFKGPPRDVPIGPNVEPFSQTPPPLLMVPAGLTNIAPGARLTSSDRNATSSVLRQLVDGRKEASDADIVFLKKGMQWVQFDFGRQQEIYAIVIWHAHNAAKVYHDVIVQAADHPDFGKDVHTLFNNDAGNRSRLGAGRNREYFESYRGKLIAAHGIKARFLRLYSNGSTESSLNEYTEVEVYGRPAD